MSSTLVSVSGVCFNLTLEILVFDRKLEIGDRVLVLGFNLTLEILVFDRS